MAAITAASIVCPGKPRQRNYHIVTPPVLPHQFFFKFKLFSTNKPYHPLPSRKTPNVVVNSSPTTKSANDVFDIVEEGGENNGSLDVFDEIRGTPIKFGLLVLFWASVSLVLSAFVEESDAHAAVSAAVDGIVSATANSIGASKFGVKVANALRVYGWPDEAVVFALATLPVVELRGAIPVGYWLQLKPWFLTVLAVLGNMVPVPFIILYLKRFASFLAQSSPSASRLLELLFKRAREKAGPIEEFQWLGLMLFVAVPFPGTGAWTGAIIASILDMPFWSAMTANFFGVVLAGLLVNLLVSLGLKYAIITGFILFLISTFMWNVLGSVKRSLRASN